MPVKSKKPVGNVVSAPEKLERLAGKFAKPAAPVSKNHLKGAALKAYGTQTKQASDNKLTLEYLPMVYKIVQQVVSYLHPPLSREDLVSAGTIGLIKAARDFDPNRDAEFKTYAYIRIRGAVIDELRGWSFAPASIKRQFEHAQQVLQEMTRLAGQAPTDEQLAQRLGMSVVKMYRMFENARARHFLSIHGMSDDTPALGKSLTAQGTERPGDRLERQELAENLSEQIQKLPDKQREIIILYYQRSLTMKEIAMVLKITESRVSQLHASALFKLSTRMRQWDDSRI